MRAQRGTEVKSTEICYFKSDSHRKCCRSTSRAKEERKEGRKEGRKEKGHWGFEEIPSRTPRSFIHCSHNERCEKEKNTFVSTFFPRYIRTYVRDPLTFSLERGISAGVNVNEICNSFEGSHRPRSPHVGSRDTVHCNSHRYIVCLPRSCLSRYIAVLPALRRACVSYVLESDS